MMTRFLVMQLMNLGLNKLILIADSGVFGAFLQRCS